MGGGFRAARVPICGGKEGDDDKLNPGQGKVADRLDHDRRNTSLVDDFG